MRGFVHRRKTSFTAPFAFGPWARNLGHIMYQWLFLSAPYIFFLHFYIHVQLQKYYFDPTTPR